MQAETEIEARARKRAENLITMVPG